MRAALLALVALAGCEANFNDPETVCRGYGACLAVVLHPEAGDRTVYDRIRVRSNELGLDGSTTPPEGGFRLPAMFAVVPSQSFTGGKVTLSLELESSGTVSGLSNPAPQVLAAGEHRLVHGDVRRPGIGGTDDAGLKPLFMVMPGPAASRTVTAPGGAAVGDLNGDGMDDLAVAGVGAQGQPVVMVLRSSGPSTYTVPVYDIAMPGVTRPFAHHGELAIGRFVGAARRDVAIALSDRVVVVGGDAGGELTGPPIEIPISGARGIEALPGGLGFDDLVAAVDEGSANGLRRARSNGGGTFDAPLPFPSSGPVGALVAGNFGGVRRLAARIGVSSATIGQVGLLSGDLLLDKTVTLDGMGAPYLAAGRLPGAAQDDLVCGHHTGQLWSLRAPDYVPVSVDLGNIGSTSAAIADFDGDGHLDIAVADRGNGTNGAGITVRLGSASGTFRDGGRFQTGSLPITVAVFRYNADARPDLAVSDSSTSQVYILVNQQQ